MTKRLHDEVLFHVELSIATADLLKAAQPDGAPTDVMDREKWQEWMEKDIAAYEHREHLLRQFIIPAFNCLEHATDLKQMLSECGDRAVIRLTLEKPIKAEQKAA